ncbi:glycosyltransferase family 4 protein [Chlorogloeopsis sp. ULAP01]|uniref:glycosyltransferase family 4 protein n=1 Tax=Chlorogloeopsis sp. ULAP01 TaxID=3056483 RepID=UPI0025AB2B41|nr:glycosyltransferase family 4 protein [Chlorogloeopsis sp. ULAP01]MDM9381025.1 glycosyltransferase family 4 protein [Chlorogloeopsis sp. ULAP01]
MKLCIVTHNVIKGDGQGRVNYEITWEAIRRGYYVTLLASQVAPELQENSQVKWIRISVKRWPTEFIRNMIFSWRSAIWLRQHRSEIELVKANGAITVFPADVNAVHFVHSSWLKFSPKVSISKSFITLLNPRGVLYDFYQWLYTAANARWEKKAFSQAKIVVAISNQIAKDLLNIGVAPECLQVILNGVDLQEFSPGTSDRKIWGLPNAVPLALFAGDIRIPRKNLDTVLQALVKVPELHLAVAGITEGSPYLQLADSLGLSDRVHFLGLRYDVPQLMKAVDFLVFPSRYEPFGLVVIEAMACGLPVITAQTTGAAELVTPESGIVLPDPDDAGALAQALLALASDHALRERMGKVARALAQNHSWDQMAQRYVDLFEELSSSSKV